MNRETMRTIVRVIAFGALLLLAVKGRKNTG